MLEVKKSLIKDAGLGVFATQDINQGDLVSEYWGKYVDLTNGDFPDSDKLLAVDEKTKCFTPLRLAQSKSKPVEFTLIAIMSSTPSGNSLYLDDCAK